MLLVAGYQPLISLILIDRLYLLNDLYPDFVIPNAVYQELSDHNELSFFKSELDSLIVHVRTTSSHQFNAIPGIDRGEIEAIALYRKLKADLLLIDDKKARDVAEGMDIRCVGTLAILFQAKLDGLIPLLKPEFQKLKVNRRFYSDELLEAFLKRNDEA